jgi:hypothetical protein
MAADWRTLKLEVLAETKQFVKGMGDANKETESFGKKLADFGKKAALALAAAGAAAIAFATKAVLAGEQAATANARIDQINKSMGLFGDSTGEVTERLVAYAEATARATGIDTNAIKATQAKLLTFKELAASANQVGGEFDRATQAAINLAAAGFGSAETNAVQLGKALQDPIKGLTALSRSGVTFTETEKERIKTLVESNQVGEAQRLILEAIEKQVGGTALATANASDRIRVGFTQVQERIGLALLPAFEKLTTFILEKVFPAFEQKVLPVFKAIGEFLETRLVPIIERYLVPLLNVLRNAFQNVSSAVSDNKGNFDSLLIAFQTIFNFAQKYLIPILKDQLSNAIQGIGTVFGVVLRVVTPIIGVIANLITGLINIIDRAIQAIINLANRAIGVLNSLIALANRIPGVNIGTISNIGTTGAVAPSITLPFGGATLTGPGLSGGSTGGTVGSTVGTIGTTGGGAASTVSKLTDRITNLDADFNAQMALQSKDAEIRDAQFNRLIEVMSQRAAADQGIVINVNSPSIIDETGFTRAVQSAIQSTQERGAGGYGFQLIQ